jgi:hypothetical protein
MSEHNDNNPDDLDTSLYEEAEESIDQGESSTARLETTITTTKPQSPIARSPDLSHTITTQRIKITTTSTSSLTLLESHKLKGAKNWIQWKEEVKAIADINALNRYIDERGQQLKPEEVDEFDPKSDEAKAKAWSN